MAGDTGGPARSTTVKVVGGFAVGAVLLYLLGSVVGWAEVARAIRTADAGWLALAVAATVAGLVAWAKVWGRVLSALSVDLPFRTVLVAYFSVTFADYVTPFGKAGGGPFVAYFLSGDREVGFHEGLASVTSTDVITMLPQVVFAAVGVCGLLLGGDLPRRADLFVLAIVAIAVTGAVAVGAVVYRREDVTDAAVDVLSPLARALPWVDPDAVAREVAELSAVVGRIAGQPRLLEETLVFSFGGWLLFAAPLFLVGRSLGVPLSPSLVLFVVAANTFASLVPTRGGLGGVEFAMGGLLVALASVDAGTAGAITLLYRVSTYWFVVVVGGAVPLYQIYAA